MKSPNFQESKSSKWLRWSVVFILTLGIFFRFVNLDKKIYWPDEAASSFILSGYSKQELIQSLYTGQPLSLEEIQRFQYPNFQKNWVDMVKNLATLQSDVHPPLYFTLVRFWTQIWGNSIAVIRSASAVISLFAFPAIYWLCLELFGLSEVGWIAIALLAVSPFHVNYAQEARMYSLWTVTILLSSAALLRAMRLNTRMSWLTYALTLALNFYSHLFSVLLVFPHGIYTVISEKFAISKRVLFYLMATLAGMLIYLPWLWVFYTGWERLKTGGSWTEGANFGLVKLLVVFLNNILNGFVDFWFVYTYIPDVNLPNLRWGILIKPLLVVLIAYSLYFLCRNAPKKSGLFVVILTITIPFILILRDLISDAGGSTQSRYLISCHLGVEISVAYLLANKINNFNLSLWTRRGWQMITILLISLGIISCGVSAQAESWSPKFMSNQHQVARFINQSANPLIISDSLPVIIFSLNHRLNPHVKLQLLSTPNISEISKDFNEVFLFQPSEELRANLQGNKNYHLSRIKNINGLWRLEK